jgi:hypothetical protein
MIKLLKIGFEKVNGRVQDLIGMFLLANFKCLILRIFVGLVNFHFEPEIV